MDIRQTLPSVIISIILLLTGAGLCLNVKLKEGNIYGISGQSINLKATYLVESSNKLHSITWKVDKSGPTRILQYIINKNKTLTSTPYRNRIRFDSKTGSLILLDFTPSDQGTYQIIVTADDGAEDKASTEVTLYEPIEGITIIMAPNQTSSIRNVTLSCSVKHGTMPKFSWTKNGKSIMETESISLCNLGQSLTLHAFGLEDCGTYTCSVANRLNNQTYSLNLLASSNFPQCRVDLSTNKRQHYIIPILIVTFSTLLTGLVIYSTKVGKIALQKSRSK